MTLENRPVTKQTDWTPIRVYAGYRIFLAISLITIFFMTLPTPRVGASNPALYAAAALAYLAVTITSALIRERMRRQLFSWTPLVPFLVDVILLTVLIHASGGISSNLGILLMVSVAAANIVAPGRGGLFIAALASLAVMFEQFWFSLQLTRDNPFNLTEPALLGISFFATALIIRQISLRLAISEAVAEQRRQAIHQLEAVNKQIVQRMRTGIIVVDNKFNVLIANPSAQALFPEQRTLVAQLVPAPIRDLYYQWRINPAQHRPSVQFTPTGPQVMVRFASLDVHPETLTLVFLEDQRQLAQQAQQLKLSSLGRMSATIAHEIRNPLSAINHAAGLLAESSREREDQRLVEIIQNHVTRVNGIIDDVLSLSRRQTAEVERFPLKQALENLVESLQQQGFDSHRVDIQIADPLLEVRFDPDQLHQVLLNLTTNAFRHAGSGVRVRISTGTEPQMKLPWLRVSDDGVGVEEKVRANLFEPFFTTSRQGTGLGLFVCRELCEANQARLDYEPGNPGSVFVITFAHPDRIFS